MSLLEIRDLRVTFATATEEAAAVDGISFTVDPGETLGLVGESGCGENHLAGNPPMLSMSGTFERPVRADREPFQGVTPCRLL